MDVRAPGIWLRQRMGKQDLDPRAKVTLDTVFYELGVEESEDLVGSWGRVSLAADVGDLPPLLVRQTRPPTAPSSLEQNPTEIPEEEF